MKKVYPLLLILLVVSGVLAQEQSGQLTLTGNNQIDEHGVLIQGGALVVGQTLTDADSNKTITLHAGENFFVDLPNERHFVSGNQQRGLEVASTVTFDELSNEDVLKGDPFICLRATLQDCRSFTAVAAGQTTLSYKRITRYVGHGNYPVPMCISIETISFNIIVVE